MAIIHNKVKKIFVAYLKYNGYYSAWRKYVMLSPLRSSGFYGLSYFHYMWNGNKSWTSYKSAIWDLMYNCPTRINRTDMKWYGKVTYPSIDSFMKTINLRKIKA